MADSSANILVVDDERNICLSCKKILEEEGHSVDFVLSAPEGVQKAISGDYEVVLLDFRMPELSGLEALEIIKKERKGVSIIIITGYATIQSSIQAIKKGAFDYVPKPFTPEELSLAVSKAIEDRKLRRENAYLKSELSKIRRKTKLIGRSTAIGEIENQIIKIAPTDFTVMIYGASGTGKELIAHAIHENSNRSENSFVGVDLSSLSPSLVESELFGHVKGAFTGATRSRPGYFSIANHGSLFFDEISNISMELQGKLLRVLETKKIRPVGGNQEHEIDVRLITATNKDLYKLVEQGEFREDLYHRLNVIPIEVSPLRERSDDVPLLAIHFLKMAKEGLSTRVNGFTTEAMAKLVAYKWPGNVRQLNNIIERLVAMVDEELIGVEHLPSEILGSDEDQSLIGLEKTPESADELKTVKRRVKDMVYRKIERRFVIKALEEANWNVTHAAESVGMLRPNFHALMRKNDVTSNDE